MGQSGGGTLVPGVKHCVCEREGQREQSGDAGQGMEEAETKMEKARQTSSDVRRGDGGSMNITKT